MKHIVTIINSFLMLGCLNYSFILHTYIYYAFDSRCLMLHEMCIIVGARIFLFVGFLVGFSSLIAACWILFGMYVVPGMHHTCVERKISEMIHLKAVFKIL